VQGKNLVSSIDVDLQIAAEEALGDYVGSAVAMDIHTGEVLAIASKPDYNLNDFSPRVSSETMANIEQRKAWINRAIQGVYSPGSTFKILVSIAGLRSGAIVADDDVADCEGAMKIGGRLFTCENGEAKHGVIGFREAIAHSCDIFFYTYGEKTQHEVIATEAQRFQLDKPTGIELPHESHRMVIPTTEWKKKVKHENWFPGDTANMSIGQGNVQVTPLEMACFAASVARGETVTKPTLVHSATPQVQHSEPIGLTPEQRAALLDGMEGCVTHGTGKNFSLPAYRVPGLRIAGKTGTAQVSGDLNVAWFICFAPLENPEIAMAIALEGDTPGETFAGGSYAVPIASAVLKTWWNKRNHLPPAPAAKKKPAATE
jgi:penicillin-binding protein 2